MLAQEARRSPFPCNVHWGPLTCVAALYSSHLEVKYDHFSVDVPVDMVGRVALSTLAAGGCV